MIEWGTLWCFIESNKKEHLDVVHGTSSRLQAIRRNRHWQVKCRHVAMWINASSWVMFEQINESIQWETQWASVDQGSSLLFVVILKVEDRIERVSLKGCG